MVVGTKGGEGAEMGLGGGEVGGCCCGGGGCGGRRGGYHTRRGRWVTVSVMDRVILLQRYPPRRHPSVSTTNTTFSTRPIFNRIHHHLCHLDGNVQLLTHDVQLLVHIEQEPVQRDTGFEWFHWSW